MGNTCTFIQAQAGEGCFALAQRCNITQDQLEQYNSASKFCDNIQASQYVCCSAGNLPDFSPKAYDNGTCFTYDVQAGDSCFSIASAAQLKADKLNDVNNQTWGWMGCDGLQAGQRICLSEGNPAFPPPISGAVCGPQVRQAARAWGFEGPL
jgi:chitinase